MSNEPEDVVELDDIDQLEDESTHGEITDAEAEEGNRLGSRIDVDNDLDNGELYGASEVGDGVIDNPLEGVL